MCLTALSFRWKSLLRGSRLGLLALGLILGLACAETQQFNSSQFLRQQFAEHLGAARAADVTVPFQLDSEVLSQFAAKVKPTGDDRSRASRIVDFVFKGLELTYSLTPTLNAVETFHSRQGNCLSFVNLFIGLARSVKLSPFFVEVIDYQRWNQREGMVVSQGHIVAGLYIRGELRTFDFLPYRVKAYKDFKPIDDLRATAHFYNNLGAEALLAGDLDRALPLLEVAATIDPAFTKGINNLGVCRARLGEIESAIELYRRGLEVEADNVPLLTNLARAYQRQGRVAEAEEVLSKVEGYQDTSPFFFVYRGELALGKGEVNNALDYMRQALRRDTEIPEVHLGLAKVYVAMGEIDKARHHLSRALTLDATHPESLSYLKLLESMP